MEPIVFLHSPKAGGTSITDALRRCYTAQEIAPTLESSPHDRRPAAWRRWSHCRFVAGHFGHEVARRHFSGHALITNFRHPVARIVSLYDFWRSVAEPFKFRLSSRSGPAQARRLTFAEFVRSDSPFLALYLADFHARQIVESGWTPRAIDAGAMRLAKERTAAMRWFYVCEHEQLSLAWLREAFPAVVAGSGIGRSNVNASRERTIPSAADEAVILERNRHDLELYDFATATLRARVRPAAPRRAA
ncbi:MAG: hypothetical protein ACKOC8_02855 [Pirellulales bacterium]